MATVVELVPLVKMWVKDRADSLNREEFVRALDVAKTHLWRIIVAKDESSNWFSERSQWGDSGADNFFPNLEVSIFQYDLPNNYHQLKEAEVDTNGEADIRMIKDHIGSDTWKEHRENQYATDATREILYDITGSGKGKLTLPFPPSKLHEVILTYIKTPTPWLLETTVTDELPFVSLDLIAEDAAAILRFGIQDTRYEKFRDSWSTRVADMIAALRRDETGPEFAVGMFEGTY